MNTVIDWSQRSIIYTQLGSFECRVHFLPTPKFSFRPEYFYFSQILPIFWSDLGLFVKFYCMFMYFCCLSPSELLKCWNLNCYSDFFRLQSTFVNVFNVFWHVRLLRLLFFNLRNVVVNRICMKISLLIKQKTFMSRIFKCLKIRRFASLTLWGGNGIF